MWLTGFEPTYSGATIRCITKSATATVADTGVEPAISKVMSLEWFPFHSSASRSDRIWTCKSLGPKPSAIPSYATLRNTRQFSSTISKSTILRYKNVIFAVVCLYYLFLSYKYYIIIFIKNQWVVLLSVLRLSRVRMLLFNESYNYQLLLELFSTGVTSLVLTLRFELRITCISDKGSNQLS